MHSTSSEALLGQLQHLLAHGNALSTLVMTVKTTSDGLLAGISEGQITLSYPRAGWLDFARTARFKQFCRTNRLDPRKEKWGKETVYRASLGRDPSGAARLIDSCFVAVYHHEGSYALQLQGFGWAPSNKALQPTPSPSGLGRG